MKKIVVFLFLFAFFGVSAIPAYAQPYPSPIPNVSNPYDQNPTGVMPGGPLPGKSGPKGGCQLDEILTDLGCFPNHPVKFVQKFYGVGLGFVGSVSLMALIGGGYAMMTSRGDVRRLNIGKSYIFYAITGLLLAIFGYVIIRVIIVDVLRVPGFS